MAIENTYLLGKNITLGCGFDLQAKAPLDSRQTVPAFAGLQALIDGNAAYEGMIVYDEETKKTYQAQIVDDVLTFREFGINEAELKDLIASETTAAMEFKGAATALPENPAKGDMYKVTASFKVGEEDVKVGDSIVYDGEQWFIIPSGDDIEDTWRPVTGVDNDSTLTFVAGDKLEKTVAADGTITYKHVAIDAPEDMTAEDDEKTRTYITELITDNHGHIIGFKTATENVEDTNTEYTFEGQSDEATSVYFQVTSNEEGASAEVVYLDAYSKNETDAELAKKIDKSVYDAYIDGKAMSDAELKKYAEDYADGLAENYAEAEHTHEIAEITDFDAKVKEYGYATTGEVADAKSGAEAKAAELDAALKTELQAEIDTDVKVVNDALEAYKTSNNEALAGVKATADAAAVKSDVDAALADRYTKEEADGKFALIADAYDDTALTGRVTTAEGKIADLETASATHATKEEAKGYADAKDEAIAAAQKSADDITEYVGTFTHATAKTVVEYVNAKTDGVATSSDLGALAGRVTTAEGKIADLETESAKHALKTEVEAVDAKFADYVTAEAYGVDKAAIEKSIEDEAKARDDADKAFETRIAALEDNFGDGEGTVEAQIAAAVKAEEDARKEAVQGVQDEVDAVEDRMDAAEGKITALEGASATHAVKTEVEAALALKADKTALEATDKTLAEVKTTVDNFFSDDAAINDTIDTLKEIANYIATDKEGATDITARVGALEGKVDVDKVSEAIDADVKVEADRAIAAEAALSGRLDTLEAIDHDAYVDADAALKAELQAEVDADVKALADGAVATNAANIAINAKAITDGDAATLEAAKTDAANKDAVVLADAQAYADQAEADAVAAAKTETENQVKALADGQVTTNKNDIADLFSQMQWGEF